MIAFLVCIEIEINSCLIILEDVTWYVGRLNMDEERLKRCNPFGDNACTNYKFKWETGQYLDDKINLLKFEVAGSPKRDDAVFACTFYGIYKINTTDKILLLK